MTLTTRLLVFFVATLAMVLVAFSVTLYLLARDNLYHETEEHLEGVLAALTAAADADADGVRWLPARREANLAAIETWGQLVWTVRDDRGRTIDHSNRQRDADILISASQSTSVHSRDGVSLWWEGAKWLVRQVEVPPKTQDIAGSAATAKFGDEAPKYRTLSITVAISLAAVDNTLFRLAAVLSLLSAGICTAALFLGRIVCRRALAPLSQMASAAEDIRAEALDRRLPIGDADDELTHLGKSFNAVLARLQESFERQKRFTSDASHQLRTPLTAILGQTEVALRRGRAVEEYQRVLRSIHQGAEHLRAIIESLLFLARADRDAILPDMEELNLREWLASHLHTWEQHPRFTDILLEAPRDIGCCRVKVHSVLAGELVNLLLDNACKYSQPGTPIQVRVERQANFVRLMVQDQGIGIREPEMEKVFSPFFRATQTPDRTVGGVGLGLSIAQRLAAAFSGSLSVTSRVGAGSSFILTLPAIAAAHADVVSAP